VSDPRAGRGYTGRTPAGLPTEDRRAKRPSRPVLVEIATAVLIVTGFMSLFTSLEAAISIAGSGEPDLVLLALFLFIGVGTVAVGIALRYGRWWLLGVNYVAVAAFLELTSGTAQGLLFGALDLFVVVVLLAQRPWFAWTPDDEPDERPIDT
jgi:hypothetical protein